MLNPPMANARDREHKEKVRALVLRRGLVGAANYTKWNELIAFMRQRTGWRPSWRYKWVNGHVSDWDVEWWHHLPFPFVGVEWFDMALLDAGGADQSAWILAELRAIGFEFEVAGDVVRIFGYLPRSMDDFPPG
jgi:hypothetical protein